MMANPALVRIPRLATTMLVMAMIVITPGRPERGGCAGGGWYGSTGNGRTGSGGRGSPGSWDTV